MDFKVNIIFILIKKDLKLLFYNKKSFLKSIIFPLIIMFILLILYFVNDIKPVNKKIKIGWDYSIKNTISKKSLPDYFKFIYLQKNELLSFLKKGKIDICVTSVDGKNFEIYYNDNLEKMVLYNSIELLKFFIISNTIQSNLNNFKKIKIFVLNKKNKGNENSNTIVIVLFYTFLLIMLRINNPNAALITVDERENRTIELLKILPVKDNILVISKIITNIISLVIYLTIIFALTIILLYILKNKVISFFYLNKFIKMYIILLVFSCFYSFYQVYWGIKSSSVFKANKNLTLYPVIFFLFFTLYFSLSIFLKFNFEEKLIKYLFCYIPFINIFDFGIKFLFSGLDINFIFIFFIENISVCIILFYLTKNVISKEKILFFKN